MSPGSPREVGGQQQEEDVSARTAVVGGDVIHGWGPAGPLFALDADRARHLAAQLSDYGLHRRPAVSRPRDRRVQDQHRLHRHASAGRLFLLRSTRNTGDLRGKDAASTFNRGLA